jgi:hypothetical protein
MNAGSGLNMGFVSGLPRPTELGAGTHRARSCPTQDSCWLFGGDGEEEYEEQSQEWGQREFKDEARR